MCLEHARDSFENLLFGLCRFIELTGHPPDYITVVGYEFKRERFETVHREALRWPKDRFSYVGTAALTPNAIEGEKKTLDAFHYDPYGCTGMLASKRQERDPFAIGPYTPGRCPAAGPLLTYCGPQLYHGPTTW
eukprot:jgi/Botrbrau1/8731/Bobra.0090s0007.1